MTSVLLKRFEGAAGAAKRQLRLSRLLKVWGKFYRPSRLALQLGGHHRTPGLRPAPLLGVLLCTGPLACIAAEPLETQVLACARVQASTERLVCYDRLGAAIAGPPRQEGTEPGAEKAPGGEEAQAVFGLPRHASSPPPEKRSALQSITARVVRVSKGDEGRALLELGNGQLWQQQEGRALRLAAGDDVKISRAALGSFWLSTSAGQGARVRRVR